MIPWIFLALSSVIRFELGIDTYIYGFREGNPEKTNHSPQKIHSEPYPQNISKHRTPPRLSSGEPWRTRCHLAWVLNQGIAWRAITWESIIVSFLLQVRCSTARCFHTAIICIMCDMYLRWQFMMSSGLQPENRPFTDNLHIRICKFTRQCRNFFGPIVTYHPWSRHIRMELPPLTSWDPIEFPCNLSGAWSSRVRKTCGAPQSIRDPRMSPPVFRRSMLPQMISQGRHPCSFIHVVGFSM